MDLDEIQAEIAAARERAKDPDAVRVEVRAALEHFVEEASPTLGIVRLRYGRETVAERLDEPLTRARRALWAAEYLPENRP